MKAWKAEISLFSITIVWGATFSFTKWGLNYASPMAYLALRLALALLVGCLVFGKKALGAKRDEIKKGAVLGLLFGGGFLLQTLGLKYTDATKSAFITGISVVFAPFVYWLVEKKKPLFWSKVGVAAAFVGLWIFARPDFNALEIGDVLTFFSAFFWAFYIVYMDKFTSGIESFDFTVRLALTQLFFTFLTALLGVFLVDGSAFKIVPETNLWISVAFNGILASLVLTFVHTAVQKYTTPVKAALIFSFEPVFASIIAVFFLGETMSFLEILGATIIFSSILLAELGGYFFPKKTSA